MRHEFIGLIAEVEKSANVNMEGIKGTVVDETRDMITIETEDGEKRIEKKNSKFIFDLPSGDKISVDGNIIKYRPEDRIKRKYKKW